MSLLTQPPFVVGLAMSLFTVIAGAYSLFVMLQYVTSPQRRERTRIKWTDLNSKGKLVGSLMIACLVFGLYLGYASLQYSFGSLLPLGDLSNEYSLVLLAFGLLGLAYTFRLAYHTLSMNAKPDSTSKV